MPPHQLRDEWKASCSVGRELTFDPAQMTELLDHDNLKPMITELRRLFLLDAVQRDLGWFTANELISTSAAKQLNTHVAESCRTIAPYSLQLCGAFQLSDEMLSAPIALDWVKFNEGDNRGEVTPN
uniref:Acyl-CoA oxidase C-terminal domain-containing protein n=1 Tax=Ciona savignyi TaxID=51511 RepID=H2ZII0_CIOSA